MTNPRRSGFWLACLLAGVGVGIVVARWTRAEQALPKTIIKSPQDLSSAFRAVSETTVPAIVSIEAQTKARVVEMDADEDAADPFGDSPFGDDPDFRQFFRQRGGQNYRRQIPAQKGAGSGFVIDASGVVVTNAHVVAGADEVTVKLSDGTELKAESWTADPVTDVAIIRVKSPQPLPVVAFGNSDAMQVGDWVLALGNPFDLGTTVTAGIISATDRKGLDINGREHFLQTDAAINPGNSGGALVNMNGEVIGINTAISTRSGGYDGVGFAIPANQAKLIVDKLLKDGTVKRARIGVELENLTPALRRRLGLDSGVLIRNVLPNSPASKAGLEAGDVIVKFNQQPIKDRSTMQEYVEQLAPDQSYPIEILRAGEKLSLEVTLDLLSSDAYAGAPAKENQEPSPPAQQVGKLGFQARTLSPEIAAQLDMDGVQGIVVESVKPGSIADEAGLQPLDVITKVAKTRVKSLEEFAAALEGQKVEEGVLLQIRRGQATALIVLGGEQ